MATRNKKSTKAISKRQRQKRKLYMLGGGVIGLLVLVVVLFVGSFVGKIEFNPFNEEDAGINEDLSSESLKYLEGYTNIALFGLDSREEGSYSSGQSDTIIIASINNETKEVKLISVYRDTLLNTGHDRFAKANSAYAKGGVEQAVQMLNANMDLNITEYVCVDFVALVEVIDALGGVEIDLTQQEAEIINTMLFELDDIMGETHDLVWFGGYQTLTGAQATSYARIRATAGDDFKRSSRQRIVLEAMLNKAKEADVATLLEICNVAFDDISTSLTLTELTDLAKDVKSYSIVSTSGFPFEMTTTNVDGQGDCVVPINLSNNITQLYAYLFGAENYAPSETVQFTSDYITELTGVTSESAAINTQGYNDTAGQEGTVFD